ncbi:MAG TPA: MMPL family transporter, partial [Mycobacterium sp.]|nr:MMPL family transporter [Mycobacterium sp.]
AVALLGGVVIGLAGANDAGTRSPDFLPPSSESARPDAAAKQFPGGDRTAAILVVTRSDGGVLNPADLAAVTEAHNRMLTAVGTRDTPAPMLTSDDGRAAVAPVPLRADLSGFALNDAVKAVRNAAADRLPASLIAHVTGGPAFGADIANSFTGANVKLLVVTALVVAVLLIVTYRSPVLWLVPLTVIGVAERVATAVGTAVAGITGLTFDGSTSGITSVLVFGAGTNYALLLISRYREELRHNADHRHALRRAVRMAGPAIVASNATVVLALLTLILAVVPSTRSLGALGACGLVVAALFVLLMLPPTTRVARASAVLAVRPATRQRRHRRDRTVASHRRRGGTTAGADRRDLGSRPRRAGDGATRHHHRAVADRAVPRESRLGGRIREARNTFCRRVGRPDRGHR